MSPSIDDDPRLVFQRNAEAKRAVDGVDRVGDVVNAERLVDGWPVACRVFLEIDVHRPALFDAPLQEQRLVAKGPAFDTEHLVVGQEAQHLAGLNLLAQIGFALFDFKRRRRN